MAKKYFIVICKRKYKEDLPTVADLQCDLDRMPVFDDEEYIVKAYNKNKKEASK